MAKMFLQDETCAIYVARGHDNGMPCSKVGRVHFVLRRYECYYMNDGSKISPTVKDLLHRSPVVKRVGQRQGATDQSATSPTGF